MSATPVPTNGFTTPTGANIPPQNPTPGFVPPVAPPAAEPTAPTPAAPAVQEPAAGGFDAAVAALLAAVQAQATPPTVPDQTTQAQVQGDDLNTLNLDSITDPVLKSMATVMQTVGKGIDMNRVFEKALSKGDASLLDVAYLKEKGGENAEQLVTIAKGIVEAVQAQAASTAKAVHDMAGGEANWNACTAAFNKSAPQEFRMVVATMMDSGVQAQVNAAAKLVVEFAKSSGHVPQNNGTVQFNASAGMPSAQALSKVQFQAELQKLNPNASDYLSARESLYARRAAGKQINL